MDPASIAPPISLFEWTGIALAVIVWIGVSILLWQRRRASTSLPWLVGGAITIASLVSAALLAALLTSHQPILVELTNQPWFIAPMIAIAIIAFLAKPRFGVAYGTVEISVALLTMWFSIRAHNDSLLVKGLGLSGGVYIFVRGGETIRNTLARRA
jgi:hypothetical protein